MDLRGQGVRIIRLDISKISWEYLLQLDSAFRVITLWEWFSIAKKEEVIISSREWIIVSDILFLAIKPVKNLESKTFENWRSSKKEISSSNRQSYTIVIVWRITSQDLLHRTSKPFNFSTGMIFHLFSFSLSFSPPQSCERHPYFSPSHPLIQRDIYTCTILDRETKYRGRKIKYSVLLRLSTSISYFIYRLSIYLYLLSSSVSRHFRIV